MSRRMVCNHEGKIPLLTYPETVFPATPRAQATSAFQRPPRTGSEGENGEPEVSI
jgi:hypothetical protein